MGQSQVPSEDEDAQDRDSSSHVGTQSFSSVPPYTPKMAIQNSNTTSTKEMHYFKTKMSKEIHAQLTLVNAEYLWQ